VTIRSESQIMESKVIESRVLGSDISELIERKPITNRQILQFESIIQNLIDRRKRIIYAGHKVYKRFIIKVNWKY